VSEVHAKGWAPFAEKNRCREEGKLQKKGKGKKGRGSSAGEKPASSKGDGWPLLAPNEKEEQGRELGKGRSLKWRSKQGGSNRGGIVSEGRVSTSGRCLTKWGKGKHNVVKKKKTATQS